MRIAGWICPAFLALSLAGCAATGIPEAEEEALEALAVSEEIMDEAVESWDVELSFAFPSPCAGGEAEGALDRLRELDAEMACADAWMDALAAKDRRLLMELGHVFERSRRLVEQGEEHRLGELRLKVVVDEGTLIGLAERFPDAHAALVQATHRQNGV